MDASGGSVFSDSATLTVSSNERPMAVIDTPIEGTTWVAGTEMSFSGHGTDPDQGDLDPSAMTWEVEFHHNPIDDPNHHTHPLVEGFVGADGTFVIANDNETDPDVWYRIHLTVADADGAEHTVFRDVFPELSQIVWQRCGRLQLRFDARPCPPRPPHRGRRYAKSHRSALVTGVRGTTYMFVGWSDGGTASHLVTTPTDDTTYTATYTAVSSARTALFVPAAPPAGRRPHVIDRLTALGFAVTVADDNGITAAAANARASCSSRPRSTQPRSATSSERGVCQCCCGSRCCSTQHA